MDNGTRERLAQGIAGGDLKMTIVTSDFRPTEIVIDSPSGRDILTVTDREISDSITALGRSLAALSREQK